MSYEVADFLDGKTAVAQSRQVWQWPTQPITLQQQTFLCATLPPDDLISSARAVVIRHDEVMVIQNPTEEPYIIPGGRREPGETVLETLHRELLEEIGWTVRNTAVIGTVHFQHLTPKPPDYPYPYPHFFWAIFAAQADEYHPQAIVPDEYVAHSKFRLIREVSRWDLEDGQHYLLQTAVKTLKIT